MKAEYDFSNAKKASNITHLSRLQAQQPLDDDVLQWLYTQDNSTKQHINEMIRQIMAIKQGVLG